MRVLALACLLLGLVVAAQAAEPLFVEYLAARKAGGSSVSVSSYHEAEKETACFRTYRYCPNFCPEATDGCYSYNDIGSIVCAECGDSQHPYADSYDEREDREDSTDFESQLSRAVEAGHCMWFKHETEPVPLAGVTGVSYAGNFYGTCTIKTEAAACALPESCNDITVNVQGVIYKVKDAIRVGPAGSGIESCTTGVRRGSREAAKADAEKVAAKIAYTREAAPTQVYHGVARVFSGFFTVFTNGPHAPKFPRGHFQRSFFGEYDDTAKPELGDPAVLGDIPRLGDDLYRFDFFPEQSASY